MDLTPYYQAVEDCVTELGIDPKLCRGKHTGQWNLRKNSIEVRVDVFKKEKDKFGYFQCIAAVSKIPETRTLEFYEDVLEKSHQLFGVGLTKYKEWIYIKIIRELEGIEKTEIMNSMQRIGNYAVTLSNDFKDKYFTDNNGRPDEV